MIRSGRYLYSFGTRLFQQSRLCDLFVAFKDVPTPVARSHLPYFSPCACKIHTNIARQSSDQNPEPARMKVISIPNPFRWLHNQMELATLKREWDAEFTIENFKAGARQAVCTTTEFITRREWGELRGLLSQKAINKLRNIKWTLDQEHNLVLNPERIQVTQVDNVSLQVIVDRRYCDIDVTIIGTCIPYNLDKHSLVVLEYFARFHREYTEGVLPEWTITVFKLKNFEAYKRRTGV
ncbi:hypothetical protein SK128_000828 [Halocaridina rubra]|uniref:Tim44-like domain-containing protein n=1 Tax=Halocaridina rubra TaxID=373956 RepID=A0AAN8XDN6_HALRR